MIERIAADAIMSNRTNRFKINYAVGYILRNIETDGFWFRHYHPANNILALKREELITFLENTTEEDFLDNISRADTKWKTHQATNILFYAHKLSDTPLGAHVQLPDCAKFNRGLANVFSENYL